MTPKNNSSYSLENSSTFSGKIENNMKKKSRNKLNYRKNSGVNT